MSNFSNFYGPKLYIGPTGSTGGTGGAGIAGGNGGTGDSGATGGTGGTGLPGVNGMPWNLISTNTNATAGSGYLINATSGNVTLTLPGAPTAGQSVGICDAYNKATTSTITIARNGANIENVAQDLILDINGISFVISYVDITVGWKIVSEADNVTGAMSAPFSFKNRIINGNMVIDQRNAGAEVTIGAGSIFAADRFYSVPGTNTINKLKSQIVADAPVGLINSLKHTVVTQYAPVTADYTFIRQVIEGYNISDLAWGTANASPITISFWVKGSVGGTYSLALQNGAGAYTYLFSFSVTTSWNRITHTIPGPTVGTWASNNISGLSLLLSLGTGTTQSSSTTDSWISGNYIGVTGQTQFVNQTAGSTLNITGVQVEKGSVATDFEYRPFNVELAMCQRYYLLIPTQGAAGVAITTNGVISNINWPVPMRVNPTVSLFNGASNNYVRCTNDAANIAVNTLMTGGISIYGLAWWWDSGSAPFTVGKGYDYGLKASAEL